MFTRWKTLEITAFCVKPPAELLRRHRSGFREPVGPWGGGGGGTYPEAERPAGGNLVGALAYSMSRSCAGGMRGGEGSMTSAPLTVW